MKVFVFKPSNEFIGKFTVGSLDEVPDELQKFVSKNGPPPPYSYVESSAKTWTIVSRNPLRLEDGRVPHQAATIQPDSPYDTQKPPSDEPVTEQPSPQTKEIEHKSPLEIRAFLLCGSVIILVGAAVLFVFALMAFEKVAIPPSFIVQNGVLIANPKDTPQNQDFLWVLGVSLAIVATVGLASIGFFAARVNANPFWYIFITGIIPGFVLLAGWRVFHIGLAAKKASKTKDDADA